MLGRHASFTPNLFTPACPAVFSQLLFLSVVGQARRSLLPIVLVSLYSPLSDPALVYLLDSNSRPQQGNMPSDTASIISSAPTTGNGDVPRKRFLLRFSKEEEVQVRRRIDSYLMPLITTLFVLAFLDRSNIGNARIAGLQESFNMSSNQFDWLLTAFYISYISFEWVGFLWNVVPAHIYVTMCLFAWGLIASLQSVVFSYYILLVLRFLLGIGEASFGPGVPMYLSFFYQRQEMGFRTGIFMSAAPLSTAFAGILAYMITSVADHTPIDSWRVLLFVEGIPCMLMACIVWNYLPDRPASAYFLSLKDKIIVRARHRRRVDVDGEQVSHSGTHGLKWDEAFEVLQDPKVYVTAVSHNVKYLI